MSKRIRTISLLMALVVLLAAAMTLPPDSALAQSGSLWSRSYGGSSDDHAYSVQQTTDGGYIVAGSTNSFGAGVSDYWVLKLASNGNVQWQKTYGGRSGDSAHTIQQTVDEGYIMAGFTTSFGAGKSDYWVLKLSPNGSVDWQKTYGGSGWDYAYSIQQTTDGGYIVAGSTGSFGAGKSDYWILKLASNGNAQWQKTYGGSGEDSAYYIQQTTEGGYIVAGSTGSFGAGSSDYWVLKLDSNGDAEWQKTYGGSYLENARCIEQTTGGGYIVAGSTDSFGAGGSDFWVLRLTSNGNIQWQKTYGDINHDYAYSTQQATDGGYIVAGYTKSFGAGNNDYWVLKLASNGNVQWLKSYRGIDNDYAYSVQQTIDGGHIVAGQTESFGVGGEDLWVLRIDEDGSIPECQLGVDTDITITNTQSTVADATPTTNNTIASISMPSYSLIDSECNTNTQCYYTPAAPIVDEPNPEEGFASILVFLETAYGFKDGEGIMGWTVYNPLWPSQSNSLKTLHVGRGYWIYVREACILQYGSSTYELGAGWNLIGWIPQL
ncbi:hypothetical protein ACFLWZ_04360 [Chloroflexota bacterium]